MRAPRVILMRPPPRPPAAGVMVLLALAVTLIGACDHKPSDPPPRVGDTSGASSDHYVSTQAWVPGRADTAVRRVANVPPAAKPVEPLPRGATCVTAECHATLAASRHIHGPVASGSCDACHDAERDIHVFPLKRAGSETCAFCHAVAGTLAHQHTALEQGCTACHDPHAAPTKYLLKADSVDHLCAACHDIPLQRYAHSPFLSNDCTVCHQPHQANNRMLLRGGEGADHCASCHEGQRQHMAQAAYVHAPAAEGCTSCHNPHTSDHPNLLHVGTRDTCLSCHTPTREQFAAMTVEHAAATDGRQCGNCHDPHAAAHPSLMRDREDRVCLSCHAQPQRSPAGRTVPAMEQTLTRSRFLHGPVQAGNCSACHDAHGGRHQDLLKAAMPATFYAAFDIDDYALCFACHDQNLVLTSETASLTEFRDGRRNLHYLHVNQEKGRTCRSCHAVHGSDLPNHIASQLPFGESNWVMPIEYQKTPGGGRCAPACHAPATYDRGQPPATSVTEGAT